MVWLANSKNYPRQNFSTVFAHTFNLLDVLVRLLRRRDKCGRNLRYVAWPFQRTRSRTTSEGDPVTIVSPPPPPRSDLVEGVFEWCHQDWCLISHSVLNEVPSLCSVVSLPVLLHSFESLLRNLYSVAWASALRIARFSIVNPCSTCWGVRSWWQADFFQYITHIAVPLISLQDSCTHPEIKWFSTSIKLVLRVFCADQSVETFIPWRASCISQAWCHLNIRLEQLLQCMLHLKVVSYWVNYHILHFPSCVVTPLKASAMAMTETFLLFSHIL